MKKIFSINNKTKIGGTFTVNAVRRDTAKAFCCALLILSACVSVSAAPKKPGWIENPYNVYDSKLYVAVVGTGNSRQMAEKDALGKLVGYFGQSIQVDEKISTSFQSVMRSKSAASWSESTSSDNTIATSASMDTLIGAEIGDAWYDGKKDYYAVAILNKTKALQTYSGLVNSNKVMINKILDMTPAEKNSFEGYGRYQFAATIADINISFGNLLSAIGAPSYAQDLKKGDDYRLEAKNITGQIPVYIAIKGDRDGRIQGALAKAIASLGFRTGGTDTRYRLEGEVSLSEHPVADQRFKYVRWVLDANLVDTRAGNAVLVPYNINDRAGHSSIETAQNKAYADMEKKIGEEYKDIVANYLSQLLPK